ncbi:MAG: heat-inducible transcriptional repressor HrcA, partial [Ignavibacteriaceae bacterium]|nr:heat-inducible transcriptional repressor HrcA [Ignavibacteriaceae bacterium]
HALNDREKNILRYVIQQFVLTATPVGSRNITKKYHLGISPATVRNIMSDLEDSGFIDHPHTSAGRIPTDKGYRFYVDSLMDLQLIGKQERNLIHRELEAQPLETDELLKIVSTLLSNITQQLACVTYPRLETGVLEKLQLVSLSSTKLLVVISIKAGLVKTITIELATGIAESKLETIQQILNERLSGLTFKEIRTTFRDRFTDVNENQRAVIRLFYDSVDKIFNENTDSDKIMITGAKNVIKQPEFEESNKFQSVIELIEDKDIIIHIVDKSEQKKSENVFISIGSENDNSKLSEYSFVSKKYNLGDTSGTLGIIGPKRMDYDKVVAIVNYVSKILTELLKNEKN